MMTSVLIVTHIKKKMCRYFSLGLQKLNFVVLINCEFVVCQYSMLFPKMFIATSSRHLPTTALEV